MSKIKTMKNYIIKNADTLYIDEKCVVMEDEKPCPRIFYVDDEEGENDGRIALLADVKMLHAVFGYDFPEPTRLLEGVFMQDEDGTFHKID